MRTLCVSILALVVCALFVPPRPGWATVAKQDQAEKLGYPAKDCNYCHTFSSSHMRDRAKELGIASTNCYTCHGSKLPLSGYDLFNRRGQFLLDEKERRDAKQADMAWLADYVDEDEQTRPPDR